MTRTAKQLKRSIMRRIWTIWTIRQVLNPVFLKVLIIATFVWQTRPYVYYAQVFRNAPAPWEIERSLTFATSAIAHAQPVTVVFMFGVALFALWLASDILRRKTEAYF